MRRALARWRFVREGHAWHGLQLALAMVLPTLLARAVGLPEAHWAAMSALIVSRADAQATTSAGWQRLAATCAGALAGLGGVALAPLAGATAAEGVMLSLVALLAFATVDRSGWRTAPITALIVMGAGTRHGDAALQVAGLRTLEIALGAAGAMAVAWGAQRLAMTARPLAVVASLLRQLAQQLQCPAMADPKARETLATTVRGTVRRLGEMVHGTRDESRRSLLQLAMRLAQDAGWLLRQLSAPAQAVRGEAQAAAAAAAAVAALQAAADRLDGASAAFATEGATEIATESATESATAALVALARHAGAAGQVDPVLTLQDDLRKLLRLAGSLRTAGAPTAR